MDCSVPKLGGVEALAGLNGPRRPMHQGTRTAPPRPAAPITRGMVIFDGDTTSPSDSSMMTKRNSTMIAPA